MVALDKTWKRRLLPLFVFPLVLFIFPAIFVVVLGPAAIVIMESFKKYF